MKITNRYGTHASIVYGILNPSYTKGGADYTTSDLLLPPKIYFMRKKYFDKISLDVNDLAQTFDGTLFHDGMEKTNLERFACMILRDPYFRNNIEERLFMEINNRLVATKFDLIDENLDLIDYKTTKIWDLIYDRINVYYERQLNFENYLIKSVMGLDIRNMFIQYNLRDWSKTKSIREEGYPKSRIPLVKYPKWEISDSKNFVESRVNLYVDLEKEKSWPDCTEEEMWTVNSSWALMKKGNKRATKVFDHPLDLEIVDNYCQKKNIVIECYDMALPNPVVFEGPYYMEFRLGQRIRCEYYCPVKQFCDQFKEYKRIKGDKNV